MRCQYRVARRATATRQFSKLRLRALNDLEARARGKNLISADYCTYLVLFWDIRRYCGETSLADYPICSFTGAVGVKCPGRILQHQWGCVGNIITVERQGL